VSIIRSEGDGEVLTINFTDLVTDSTFRLEREVKVDERRNSTKGSVIRYEAEHDALTEKQRKEVSRRFELIKPLLVLERTKENCLRAKHEFMAHYKEYLAEN
jgi:putative transposase